MIIRPEDAAAVEKARNFAHGCKMRPLNADLEPNFVAHAFIAEAMKLLFDCDNTRAQALASGLTMLAFADERSDTKDGAVLADYILTRSVNDPTIVDRFRAMAGLNAAAGLAQR